MKRLLGICLGLLFSVVAEAKLTAHLTEDNVRLGDSFNLIIEEDEITQQSTPDLTPLQQDFTLLGTQRSVNYAMISGQTTSVSQWIVLLRPNKSGTLTIPPIQVGFQKSNPLTINVTGSSNNTNTKKSANKSNDKDVFFRTEVDNTNPYVNQQVIYTVKMYNNKRLLDSQYQAPEAENALIIPLKDSKQYQRTENDINYLVEEQRYAIFPQKSGPVTITSPILKVLVYDMVPTEKQLQDKPIVMNVQPAKNLAGNGSWLPAKGIYLSEEYDNSNKILSQGNTFVRTVTLEARGIPAQFLQSLPSLTFEDKNQFRVYPEQGKQLTVVQNGDIVGKITVKVTYLFNTAGEVTLPELRIPWFNTETKKEEIAALPPRTIEITPVKSASKPTNAVPSAPLPSKVIPSPQSVSVAESINKPNSLKWIVLATLFALAWLITMVLFIWQRSRMKPGRRFYKHALQNLHAACIASDPNQTRKALLEWANLHWPDAKIMNLMDVMKYVHDLPLKKQIHSLSQALYSQENKANWRGESLWQALQPVINQKKRYIKKPYVLPPMNPL